MTVTSIEKGTYLVFKYANETSGSETTMDFKIGDVLTLVQTIGDRKTKYTGRLASIGDSTLNLDISTQYKSNIVAIKFTDITLVLQEEG